MWYEERSDKTRRPKNPEFSDCCLKGKVELPMLEKPPPLLWDLMNGNDPRWKNFKENIRAYNSMFLFTSIGGKLQTSVNDGNGPPRFILFGQDFHRIGSLLPDDDKGPRFAQLYIYDTENECNNRMKNFRYLTLELHCTMHFDRVVSNSVFLYIQVQLNFLTVIFY